MKPIIMNVLLLCFQMSQNCVSATENIVCVIVLLSLVPDVRRTGGKHK